MRDEKSISKFMSLVLRHKPEVIGLTLSTDGWVSVIAFMDAMNANGHDIDMVLLQKIVSNDNKGRYSFDDNKVHIRANQGHSANVELNFKEVIPLFSLYHGTNKNAINEIMKSGILKMSRHHVHLSSNLATAKTVGERRGSPVIVEVDACRMHLDGCKFYMSENGVYLTDYVAPKYLITNIKI